MPQAKKKNSYHHGNLKQSLVDTAVAIIAERKHADFTLRELAKHLNVTHAATYHHFRDKEDLLAVVARQGYITLSALLEESVSSAKASHNSIFKLYTFGLTYLEFALDNQAHFRVMFGHKFGDLTQYPDIEEASRGAQGLLLSILTQAKEEGFYVDANTDELLALQWASLHGLALLTINGHFDQLNPREDIQGFFTRVLQHLLCGTATEDGAQLFQALGDEDMGCPD